MGEASAAAAHGLAPAILRSSRESPNEYGACLRGAFRGRGNMEASRVQAPFPPFPRDGCFSSTARPAGDWS